jgi:histidyl-tRNA synthetase
MAYRAPKGTDDFLPPDSAVWVQAERAFLDLAEYYGYGLTLTPIFESTDLFVRGVGEATEVVERQMYTFTDKGGRSLTLRPEATASVVRAVLQRGRAGGVFKGSYWGPMFRYERPQKGRRRQFVQAGIEYLGEPSADADVEVIEFGYRYLETLGVPAVQVFINSIGDPDDRIAYREELVAYFTEAVDLLSEDAKRRINDNPMRILDSKADAKVVAGAPVPTDYLGTATRAHFETVLRGLERANIPYRLDPRLVRGLDYYNRTVWEYVPGGFDAAQNSVGGGGRYDGLFELLGGKPNPSVGLAMGMDRIILAMSEQESLPALDAFVVLADQHEGARRDALDLVSRLRNGGLRVDIDLGRRSVKAQFRAADRRNSAAALVVGDEWRDGKVTVRDLTTGDQEQIAVEEIERWLKNR